jgi:hypothetical protein
VRGLDTDGYEVLGKLYKEAKANDQQVLIEYDINEAFENYVNCQVGANPAPNVGGCKFKLLLRHKYRMHWFS